MERPADFMVSAPRRAKAPPRRRGEWLLLLVAVLNLLAAVAAMVLVIVLAGLLPPGGVPLTVLYPGFFIVGMLVAWSGWSRPRHLIVEHPSTVNLVGTGFFAVILTMAGIYTGLLFAEETRAKLDQLFQTEAYVDRWEQPAERKDGISY